MNNTITAFLLSFLAGASTIIGALIIFLIKKKTTKIINIALSFSAAIMFFLSIFDLIPESLNFLKKELYIVPSIIILIITILIGFKVAKLIDKKFPDGQKLKIYNGNLYRIGLISMITIILHNIPEGIATFVSTNENIYFGITITLAISMHNIPEGISIALPIYYATNKKGKALLYTAISGLSELFGAIITYLFLLPFINNITLGILFSLIAGIMIYISIFELLKEAIYYHDSKTTIFYVLIGLIFIICYFLFL